MKPQRMKYQWFQDVPRNVTKREYNGYQLRVFGAVGLGMMAVMTAIASLFGLTLQTSQDLAHRVFWISQGFWLTTLT